MRAERFQALDAWRGIAALIVALEHLNVANPLHQNGLVHHGFRFVDFFFVLSGFVIAHAYRERLQRPKTETRPFLVRRLGRLWPLHVVILIAFIAFEVGIAVASRAGISFGHVAFTDRNTIAGIGAHLALVQGMGIFDHLTWNGPSWSISTEVFAYALFAAVCATFRATRIDVIAFVLMLAAAGVVLFVAPDGMGSTFDFGAFRCVYGFMAGVLTRSLWGRYSPRVGTAGEISVVIALAAAVIYLPNDEMAVLVTPMFAVAVWVFAAEHGAVSRMLLGRWPQALGAWSYSIYMVHVLLAVGILTAAMLATKAGFSVFARIDGIVTIVGPPWFTTVLLFGYVVLVIAIASFTYRHVELRGQRFFRRWAKSTTE